MKIRATYCSQVRVAILALLILTGASWRIPGILAQQPGAPSVQPAPDPLGMGPGGQPYLQARIRSAWQVAPMAESVSSGAGIDAARDHWAELVSPAAAPLDTFNPPQYLRLAGRPAGPVPQTPAPAPGQIAFTGTFTSYRAVLTASKRSVYSVAVLSVDKVWLGQMPGGATTAEFLQRGGAYTFPDGRTITFDYVEANYGIQPGRRYFMLVTYSAATDSFTDLRSWEIRDGRAVPAWPGDNELAEEGRSRYAGLPESRFITNFLADLAAGGA